MKNTFELINEGYIYQETPREIHNYMKNTDWEIRPDGRGGYTYSKLINYTNNSVYIYMFICNHYDDLWADNGKSVKFIPNGTFLLTLFKNEGYVCVKKEIKFTGLSDFLCKMDELINMDQ